MSTNRPLGLFAATRSLSAIYAKSGGKGAPRKNASQLTRAFHPSGEVRVDLSEVPTRDWRVITQALETGVIGENNSAAVAILDYLTKYVAPMPGVLIAYVGKTNLGVQFPISSLVYVDEDGERRADELVGVINPLLSLQHGTAREICGKSRDNNRHLVSVYSSGYRIPHSDGNSFGEACLEAVRPFVQTAIDYPLQSEPRKKLLEAIKDKPILTIPFNGV